MQTYRTVLEQKIRERRQTLLEFVEYAEDFAREHKESGTLSLRHLQRLIAGQGSKGKPLGPLRPATARLLEHIFGQSIDELLSTTVQTTSTDRTVAKLRQQPVTVRRLNYQDHNIETPTGQTDQPDVDLTVFFDWLDEHAGWIPDTTRRKVTARLAKMDMRGLVDQRARRARVSRNQIVKRLSEYYRDREHGAGMYHARCERRDIGTTIVTRSDWLDLECALGEGRDHLTLVQGKPDCSASLDDLGARHAVQRLAESTALNVRVTNVPLYRLLGIKAERGTISGSVCLASFAEYALTMDLLENELIDYISTRSVPQRGSLPLRDRYLPDLASVPDVSGRLCAGGVLGLCAIARPSDPYRGGRDYALLIQQRSGHVLNAVNRLAVVPKGFHEPLTDVRSDVQIGVTLQREMEEELFGRSEVDTTISASRAAAPMHPQRLSAPMRWLLDDPGRLRMECTGFGLNLVSGNYEFACLIVIEDEEFWARYGGHVEANWESSGLRLYSSLDHQLMTELIFDESWSNEGLFAFLQGLRRLDELGGDRVNLPAVEWHLR